MRVAIVVVLIAVCNAASLESRDGASTSTGGLDGVPGLAQLQQQLQGFMTQVQQFTSQLTRGLGTSESGSNGPAIPGLQQLQGQVQVFQTQLQTAMQQFTRAFGGLEADANQSTGGDSQSSTNPLASIPGLAQVTQQLQLLQQQLQSVMTQFTRTFGGLMADGASSGNSGIFGLGGTDGGAGGLPGLSVLTSQFTALQQQLQGLLSQFTRVLSGGK